MNGLCQNDRYLPLLTCHWMFTLNQFIPFYKRSPKDFIATEPGKGWDDIRVCFTIFGINKSTPKSFRLFMVSPKPFRKKRKICQPKELCEGHTFLFWRSDIRPSDWIMLILLLTTQTNVIVVASLEKVPPRSLNFLTNE